MKLTERIFCYVWEKHIVHLNNLDHDILFFQADVE